VSAASDPVEPRVMDPVLKKLGFARVREKGSHVFNRHPDGRTTCDLAAPLVRAILRSWTPPRGSTASTPSDSKSSPSPAPNIPPQLSDLPFIGFRHRPKFPQVLRLSSL
jgi:predicted RNA binding protein YcfA (HicA-like mRNA interferase family)